MICRLCKKASQLRNSHIIPEFLYSSLYDEKHRFHQISTDREKKNALEQKGIRECLLCENCEQKLSKYERYASQVLNGGVELTVKNEGRLIHLEGIDYSKFKIFGLSVLWRASVSSLEIFEQVRLGPHEEILRKYIHNEGSVKEYEYPFILSPILHEGELQKDIIIQPTKTKLDGHHVYRFTFGGVLWLFIVSNHRAPKVIDSCSLSFEGKLTMLPSEISELNFMSRMAVELMQQGKV